MTSELTAGPHAPVPTGLTAAAADPDLVLEALAGVRDPELDESITSLGFVTSCTVSVRCTPTTNNPPLWPWLSATTSLMVMLLLL